MLFDTTFLSGFIFQASESKEENYRFVEDGLSPTGSQPTSAQVPGDSEDPEAEYERLSAGEGDSSTLPSYCRGARDVYAAASEQFSLMPSSSLHDTPTEMTDISDVSNWVSGTPIDSPPEPDSGRIQEPLDSAISTSLQVSNNVSSSLCTDCDSRTDVSYALAICPTDDDGGAVDVQSRCDKSMANAATVTEAVAEATVCHTADLSQRLTVAEPNAQSSAVIQQPTSDPGEDFASETVSSQYHPVSESYQPAMYSHVEIRDSADEFSAPPRAIELI
jgi:hypothetical protein